MFLHLVNIIGPIVLIVLAGYIYSRRSDADMSFVNRANMDLFVPALIFSTLTGHEWSFSEYSGLVYASALLIVLPGLLTLPLCRLWRVDWRVLMPPMMFNNSGNLGIPLFVFAFGEEILPIAVLVFIVENTLHFTLGAAMLNHGKYSWWETIKSVASSPMILATVLAVIFHQQSWALPTVAERSIELIGEIAIPLMLFALGIRMRNLRFTSARLPLISALWVPATGVLSMAIVLLLASAGTPWLQLSTMQTQILWLFAVLPPAVLNFLVAERYLDTPQEKQQVAELVLWGNLASIATLTVMLALVTL